MQNVQDPRIAQVFKRPFAEQAAFFRGKLGNLLPSKTWKDVQKSQHDRGFMVAGAQSADLLADLAAAADRFQVEGKGIEAFRKDFDAIVELHGWKYRGERNWRTRTIYTTNMAANYSGGRLAQLREGGFPWWMYKHSDLVLNPRPLHVSWDGLTLPADDPWWQTHYPPNGWGCHCRVVGLRRSESAKRYGGLVRKAAPDDGVDPRTGAPAGIDKGWDYMPGNTVSDAVRAMAEKTTQWEYTLAKAYMQGVPASGRDALAMAYRRLPSVADDARRYAARILEEREHLDIPPYRTLGLLTGQDADRIKELTGAGVERFDYALDPSAVRHIESHHGKAATEETRGPRPVEAADYARLPALLNNPDRVQDAGRSKTGHPLVRIAGSFGGETLTAIWEVRKRRRSLALQSLWIGSGASPR